MHKIWILPLGALLALAGCSDGQGGAGGPGPRPAYTSTDEIGRIIAANPADWTSCTPPAEPPLPPVVYGPAPAYPNATNGICLLGFTIPVPREVTLSIWREAGEEAPLGKLPPADTLLLTLTSGRHTAGRHLLRWDGKDNQGTRLPPGSYICRFETQDCVSTGEIRIIACPYGTDRLLTAASLRHLDANWSLERLLAAFDPGYLGRQGADASLASVVGAGLDYFPFVGAAPRPEDLPMYVSRTDDLALFVENIAMWNQLVFGWSDFVDPRAFYEDIDPQHLADARVSRQREVFRGN